MSKTKGADELGVEELRKQVDELHVRVISSLRDSVKATQSTFTVNFYINIIVVAIGIILLMIAIGQSILKGIDPFSVTFGGLGVANFVAVFLLNPQSRLQNNLCGLSQINLILSNFFWSYDRFLDSIKPSSKIKELQEINKEGERIVSFALESIKKFVSSKEK